MTSILKADDFGKKLSLMFFTNFLKLMQNAASHEAKQSICYLATAYNKNLLSKHQLRHFVTSVEKAD